MFFSKMTLCHKNDRGVYIYAKKQTNLCSSKNIPTNSSY